MNGKCRDGRSLLSAWEREMFTEFIKEVWPNGAEEIDVECGYALGSLPVVNKAIHGVIGEIEREPTPGEMAFADALDAMYPEGLP